MDPIMLQIGPLALRWYGFLIAMGVLIGSNWTLHEAKKRGLDTEKLLDMTLWLVISGLVGARLVYVLTSPGAYFGPDGNPLSAFAIWQGGGSIHGGVLGIFVAVWIYSRIHHLNMWSYLDVLTQVGALGVIGGRIGNFMNGSDTTGRVTGWPVGFTWPEPGTPTFGAVGRFIFGNDLWANSPQVVVGGQLAYGPVHLTQGYGVLIGIALYTLVASEPFGVYTNPKWLGGKLLAYGLCILCGIMIRRALRPFGPSFGALMTTGSTPEVEQGIVGSIRRSEPWVYGIWAMVLLAGVLGVIKPGSTAF